MKTKRPADEKVAEAVAKLTVLAQRLRQGEPFQITRLTLLKGLCQNPLLAARFGLYLTKLARHRASKSYRPLLDKAITELRKHLKRPSYRAGESLGGVLRQLEDSQNQIERHRWADVRIIHSREALLAEYALRCIARPWESAHWGYRLAAVYAERYNPRYGTGLIPESAPAVEEITRFWSRHHHGTRTKALPSRARTTGARIRVSASTATGFASPACGGR